MKILIYGGTGFLGSHLTPKLIAENHEVVVLTRKEPEKTNSQSENLCFLQGDILFPETFIGSLQQIDLIINVAMPKITPGERINKKRFLELSDQTTRLFKNPIDIAKKLDIPIIVTSGTSFKTKPGEIADETWPIYRGGMPKVGIATDKIIEEAMISPKAFLIQMLPGQIYGNGGMFKKYMIPWMLKGKFKIIGNGQNHIPRIHVEDCANAYVEAVKKLPVGEKFILADDYPCTVTEFTNFVTDFLGMKPFGRIPVFPVRLLKGKLIAETIMMDCLVNNNKAKSMLGWKLSYPTFKEGLTQALNEIRNEPEYSTLIQSLQNVK